MKRLVCSRYGTAQEASVDNHGAMASHGHTFDDCRLALLQSSGLTEACQADTLARPPVGCCSDLSMVHALYCEEGVGLICRIDAYRPKGRWFESRSSGHVYGPWASSSLTVTCGASGWKSETVSVLYRERLLVVVDLKRRYRNGLNEL